MFLLALREFSLAELCKEFLRSYVGDDGSLKYMDMLVSSE
jgi:hypothetical protein